MYLFPNLTHNIKCATGSIQIGEDRFYRFRVGAVDATAGAHAAARPAPVSCAAAASRQTRTGLALRTAATLRTNSSACEYRFF